MEDFYIVFTSLLGLVFGSFLNCLIWRLYKEETIAGRSYCPHCRHTLAWYDNVPILSFLLLRGRCRYCKGKISWQYPLVELITAVLFVLSFLMVSNNTQSGLLIARDWLLIMSLIIIFVYDFRWQLVPMTVIWPVGLAILALNLLLGFSWFSLLCFSLIGAGFFYIQYVFTKKRGIGEGDIWLGALLGLAFPNAGQLLLIMVLSYCLGSIVGLFLISKAEKDWKSRIALGPFLSLGAIITLIWGERIITWYLGLF